MRCKNRREAKICSYVLLAKTHLREVVETPWYDFSTFAVVSRECLRLLLYIIWCICQSPLQGTVRFFLRKNRENVL